MTTDIIQYASIAGELAPNLFGRTDFEKYDSAWAKAENWFVDYRGGLFTRAGLEFKDYLRGSGSNGEYVAGDAIRLIDFQFAPDESNTYLVLFTHNLITFVQNGNYVLEAAKTVSGVAKVSSGARIEVTFGAAHGFSAGDRVKLSGFVDAELKYLNGRTFRVGSTITSTTIQLTHPQTAEHLGQTIGAFTYTAGATAARVYTLVSTYTNDDLPRMKAVQMRDTLRITHPDHFIANLTRIDHTNWTLADEVISNTLNRPGVVSVEASTGTVNRSAIYAVTAVFSDGRESLQSFPRILSIPAITEVVGNSVTVNWTDASGDVLYYNVYRSRLVDSTGGNTIATDMELGFIGTTPSSIFTDPGITPDFQKQPPISRNPFAGGAVEYVKTVTAGTGADATTTVGISGAGSNFLGYPIFRSGTGAIEGIDILRDGKDYTNTQVLKTAGAGSGYEGLARLSPATGNNPHCCHLFEQRQVYGGTDNFPLRVFGSQPGLLSSFDKSKIASDDDAYQLDLDTEKVAPIRHLLPVRGGLLVFNQVGIWLLSGPSGQTLTPNNAQAGLQNNVGASNVQPEYLDNYVVYISAKGQELRMLAYDDYSKVYGGRNVSILSNHLFSAQNEVKALAYSASPFKLVVLTQEDGTCIVCTIENENSVYAAAPWKTDGKFISCGSIEENLDDVVYFAVERDVAGSGQISAHTALFLERLVDRRFSSIETAFCVDAGLQGSFGSPITLVSGFAHLAGETITLLADGVKVTKAVTAAGTLTLDVAASDITGGLPYTCTAKTLPLTASDTPIEGRRKDIVGTACRIMDTYGLKAGPSLSRLKTIQDPDARYGWASGTPRFRSDMIYEPLSGDFSRNKQIYFVQDMPYPAAILAFTRDVDLGDDKD